MASATPFDPDSIELRDSFLFRGTSDMGPAAVHLPRTDEFVTNNRGQRLHVRSVWPADLASTKCCVLAMHGYGAHSNRPTFRALGEALCGSSIAFISFDFHGHGYSEGERGLVEAPVNLVDDALSVLLALYAPATSGLTSKVTRPPADLRLFIMGHSMGGGTSLVVSHLLGRSPQTIARTPFFDFHVDTIVSNISPCFQGAVLLAPVSGASVVPGIVRHMLLRPLSCLFPKACLPACLLDENSTNSRVWSSPTYRCYIEADGFPANPMGLSYGGNMRFSTGASILALGDIVKATLTHAVFPFLVLHDPVGDITLPITGSEALLAASPSDDKVLIHVPDALHDLLANKPKAVIQILVDWLFLHQQAGPPLKPHHHLRSDGRLSERALPRVRKLP